ncbi:MAG: hypothetical protein ACKOZT_12810 [Cyanobium sp.]
MASAPDDHSHEAAAGPPLSQAIVALPDRKAVLAASAPWLGALLNVLPGLGAGYLYQRRWRAWWITSLLGALAFGLGTVDAAELVAADGPGQAPRSLGGLLLIAAVSASEAFLAARRARMA